MIADITINDDEWGSATGADAANRAELNALLFEHLLHPIPLKLLQDMVSSFDKTSGPRANQAAVLGRWIKVKKVIETGCSPNSAIGQAQMLCDLVQMESTHIAMDSLAAIQDLDQGILVATLAVEIGSKLNV